MYPTPLSLLLLLFAVPAFVYAWLMNSGNAAAVGLGILAFLLYDRKCKMKVRMSQLVKFDAVRTCSASVIISWIIAG